ncbi:MAG: hypothetical protein ACLFTH_02585 [Candidatus Woesearchaeota archaeon]
MNPSQYADFQTEKDLHNCGLTQDSIEAIKATSVVTHNGAQHVVPESQAGRFEHTEIRSSETTTSSDSTKTSRSSDSFFRMQLDEQQRMFSRFKNYADKRISTLESGLQQAVKELNDMKQQMETLKSNQRAQNKVQASAPQGKTVEQNASHGKEAVGSNDQFPDHCVQETQQQSSGKQDVSDDEPIDRNKTAPADVKVESIFYCGQR